MCEETIYHEQEPEGRTNRRISTPPSKQELNRVKMPFKKIFLKMTKTTKEIKARNHKKQKIYINGQLDLKNVWKIFLKI